MHVLLEADYPRFPNLFDQISNKCESSEVAAGCKLSMGLQMASGPRNCGNTVNSILFGSLRFH